MTLMQRIVWPFYLTYMVVGIAAYTLWNGLVRRR